MRISLYFGAAALCLVTGAAQALPVTSGSVRAAADAISPVEQSAVFVYEGYNYCFYFDGWHGPGWYRCGFSWRRGLGWGGVYGWRGWEYGPAARRFGHGGFHHGARGFSDRGAVTTRSVRQSSRINNSVRTNSVRTNSARINSNRNARIQSTQGARTRSARGANIQRETTGSGAGARMNAGPSRMGVSGGGHMGGGGRMGGGGGRMGGGGGGGGGGGHKNGH